MLPAAHRLRSSADFTAVTRRGRRASSHGLVVYLLPNPALPDHRTLTDQTSADPVKVGLIVGRSVGGSVVRHRVSRRLRAQLAGRLHVLPAGSQLVVRALPAVADSDSAELAKSLDQAVGRLLTGARR